MLSDTLGWAPIVVEPCVTSLMSAPVRTGESPEGFSGLCSRARGSGLHTQAGVGEHLDQGLQTRAGVGEHTARSDSRALAHQVR